MGDNQTVKDRLIQFIAYLGIGQGKFEKKCGLSNAYVANIRVSISPKKLQQITQHCPELNPAWLMTGEGEMLRSGAVQQATASGDGSVAVSGNNNSHIGPGQGGGEAEVLRERVKSLEALLEEKERIIGILMDGRK